MIDGATNKRLDKAAEIIKAIQELCWCLGESPNREAAGAVNEASNRLREALVSSVEIASDVGEGVVLSKGNGGEIIAYIYQPFSDGIKKAASTFKSVRSVRGADIDWTKARQECSGFNDACFELFKFIVWCRALEDDSTIQDAEFAVLRERDRADSGKQGEFPDAKRGGNTQRIAFAGQTNSPCPTLYRVASVFKDGGIGWQERSRKFMHKHCSSMIPEKMRSDYSYPSRNLLNTWVRNFKARVSGSDDGRINDNDFPGWTMISAKISAATKSDQ